MLQARGYIIGIDGGGSTCRVAIASADGTRIAATEGGAANPATSMTEAIASLRAALQTAQTDAGLDDGAITGARAYLGLAGVIDDRLADAVAAAMPIDTVIVTDDRPTNMAGALGARDGFVAALGTGSFIGRQQGAVQSFVGGWGFWLGDQASGGWIGRAALAAVLEWRDGLLPTSPMLASLLAEFSDDPGEIVHFAARAAPPDFAAFAPRVFDAADAGDRSAKRILEDATGYLTHALDTLGFETGAPLCLIGGVGPRFATHLGARYTANLTAPNGTALDGALQLAAQLPAGTP
ncbi:MAG: BadF/BadG/BcrA/BcrD ATPase family protein [Rhodobacter sp.]|nr:BadF/BadG/BcrA/BcrD ATPase family protein [Rhodobacter sp.]